MAGRGRTEGRRKCPPGSGEVNSLVRARKSARDEKRHGGAPDRRACRSHGTLAPSKVPRLPAPTALRPLRGAEGTTTNPRAARDQDRMELTTRAPAPRRRECAPCNENGEHQCSNETQRRS